MFKTLGEAKAAGFDLWTCYECTATSINESKELCHGDDCPAKRRINQVQSLQGLFEFVAPVRR